VEEYLNSVTATAVDATKHVITDDIVAVDVDGLDKKKNEKDSNKQ